MYNLEDFKSYGELLAAKEIQTDKYIVVVYKERSEKDGFVITEFLSSLRKQLERRRMVGRSRNRQR